MSSVENEYSAQETNRPPSSSAVSDLKLFCYLVGSGSPFSVVISRSDTVYELQERIQQEKPNGLKGIDAGQLKLFKVSIPVTDEDNLAEQVKKEIEGEKPLLTVMELSEPFPNEPLEETIHIAVKLPDVVTIPSRRIISHPELNILGWSRDFVGHHHHVLLENIKQMHRSKVKLIRESRWDQTRYGHLNHVALNQSSGSGKSRMVDELAKLIPTIPINLRASADTRQYAYPHPDAFLRDLFIEELHFNPMHESVLQARFYHILIAVLELVTEKIVRLMEGKGWSELSELAQAWHQYLESNEQAHRRELYEHAKNRVIAVEQSIARSNRKEHLNVLENDANKRLGSLCESIRKLGLNKEELHLVLYIDEVDGLADKTVLASSGVSRTALESPLSTLSEPTHPIFVIYISTQSDTSKFTPDPSAQLFSSARKANFGSPTEAFLVVKPGIPLSLRTTFVSGNTTLLSKWHSMMLPWSQKLLKYVQGESQEFPLCSDDEEKIRRDFDEMIRLARCKLLNSTTPGEPYQSKEEVYFTRTAKMAIIGVRLMPIVEASYTVARELVASHMQTVFSIHQSRKWIRSGYPSEPVLAEAAAWQVEHWRSEEKPGEPDCIDLLSPSEIGEVTGHMILLTARDHAGYLKHKQSASLSDSDHVLLTAFIMELFPNNIATALLDSKAPNDPKGCSLREAFEHDVINFTHWERFADDSAATPKALLSAFIRGAAIICHNNSPFIDAIIPVLRRENADNDTLNETNMTAVLVQFKLRHKPTSLMSTRVTAESVDLVRPNETTSRPYIVMIMELGIGATPHTLFNKTPTQRKSKADEESKKRQAANQSPRASSPPSPQTSSVVIPSVPTSKVVTRSSATPELIHPGYIIHVRGCSDFVYKVVRKKELDMYKSLLRKSALLADHPRQDPQTIQMVRQQRPFVSEDKASHHWNDIYGDIELPGDGTIDLDTTGYSVGAAAERLFHSEEEGGENRMEKEVEGEERMDKDDDGRENRMDEEEDGEGMDQQGEGERGMDEMEP
ncbi:hypothetical protein K435DRAFT_804533 [Dendrothele bispora CBS 962.96]|uniref:Crinkler effector protein N-terminal domain-containing protein n=1 Tax=Dendrothele bispora (strain CBS 962.96) TaxID=1314807 RepID=A0A4S8LEQ6_DENBC|nr:hypothetical protein K435DRAFT_804533 [Dendrothele bispora CBS 962.96]